METPEDQMPNPEDEAVERATRSADRGASDKRLVKKPREQSETAKPGDDATAVVRRRRRPSGRSE
jgi:hypothetical protein